MSARTCGAASMRLTSCSTSLRRWAYDRDPRPVLTTTSADQLDLARSSTSDARRALIGAGLLTEDGEPVLPELFWALAREWAPTDRRWLASVPDPEDWDRAHDPTEPTWRLGGAQAAIELGAPIVTAADGPIDLYVPGPVLLSIAVRRCGSSDPLAAAASVAVPAMVPLVRAAAALEAEDIPPFAVIGGVAVTGQRCTPTALEVLRARDEATDDAADPHTITIAGAEVQFQDVEPVDDADVAHLDHRDLLYVAGHAHALADATRMRLLATDAQIEATAGDVEAALSPRSPQRRSGSSAHRRRSSTRRAPACRRGRRRFRRRSS